MPGPGGKKQITSGGGLLRRMGLRQPHARLQGFRNAALMAVPITLNGSVVEVGKPVVQEARLFGIVQSPDGQQVLQGRGSSSQPHL